MCGLSLATQPSILRAAHLAACNAVPHSAAGSDIRLPSYHFTHACLRDALASALRDAGIYTQTEVAGMMEGNTRPGDCVGWTSTQTLVLDVTVTHLLTPSNVNDGERAPGRAISADEKLKRDKYEAECRARVYDFVPFAVDDFGHLGDSAQSFLEQPLFLQHVGQPCRAWAIFERAAMRRAGGHTGCAPGGRGSRGRCTAASSCRFSGGCSAQPT